MKHENSLNLQFFGGRGASSHKEYRFGGKKHVYGDEYNTIFQDGNIKFIKINGKSSTPPRETQTKGRVYVTVTKGIPKYVTYYDKDGKKKKQIDVVGKPHMIDGKPTIPHVHEGYSHEKTRALTDDERTELDRIRNLWDNRNRQRVV